MSGYTVGRLVNRVGAGGRDQNVQSRNERTGGTARFTAAACCASHSTAAAVCGISCHILLTPFSDLASGRSVRSFFVPARSGGGQVGVLFGRRRVRLSSLYELRTAEEERKSMLVSLIPGSNMHMLRIWNI